MSRKQGSELADGDPDNKMKGRAVLLGDNVCDKDFNWAELCELGPTSPSMEAAKALDAMVHSLGMSSKQAMPAEPTPNPS